LLSNPCVLTHLGIVHLGLLQAVVDDAIKTLAELKAVVEAKTKASQNSLFAGSISLHYLSAWSSQQNYALCWMGHFVSTCCPCLLLVVQEYEAAGGKMSAQSREAFRAQLVSG
jgi:hypothetical protein